MPVTLSAEDFAAKYGSDTSSTPTTLSAEDFAKKYGQGDVRSQIAARKANPPANAYGDPNGERDPGGFWSGVRDTAVPTLSGIRTAADAIGAEGPGRMASAIGTIGSNIYRGSRDEANRAQGALSQGNYVEAGGHAVAAAIPVIGPAAAHAGEQIAQGNFARGAGEAVGTVGSVLAPELAGRGAQAVMGRMGTRAADSALTSMRKAIDPQELNPNVATPVAREMISDNVRMKNPQAELPGYLQGKADAIDTRTPILNSSIDATTEPIVSAIRQSRDQMFNEIGTAPLDPGMKGATLSSLRKRFPDARLVIDGDQVSIQQIRHPDMRGKIRDLNMIERHIQNSGALDAEDVVPLGQDADATVREIRAQMPDAQISVEPGWGWDRGDMGEAVVHYSRAAKRGETAPLSNETMANLHTDYNYFAAKNGAFGNGATTNPIRLPGNAVAAGAIRDVVNADPAVAAANQAKTNYLTAKETLPENAGTPQPYQPSIGRVLGEAGAVTAAHLVGGPLAAGVTGAAIGGGELVKYVKSIVTSPSFQTWSALKKAHFAEAVANNDISTIGAIVGTAPLATSKENGPLGESLGSQLAAKGQQMSYPQAADTLKQLINSPLWKVTGGEDRRSVARAMQKGDLSTVSDYGSRILGGSGLDDQYGHDSAIHHLVSGITQNGQAHIPPPMLNQVLRQHEAVYVQPDGSIIQIPHHVLMQTFDQLSGQ